jgi:hypothetical protein
MTKSLHAGTTALFAVMSFIIGWSIEVTAVAIGALYTYIVQPNEEQLTIDIVLDGIIVTYAVYIAIISIMTTVAIRQKIISDHLGVIYCVIAYLMMYLVGVFCVEENILALSAIAAFMPFQAAVKFHQ